MCGVWEKFSVFAFARAGGVGRGERKEKEKG